MHKKDLGAIRAIFDIQSQYVDGTIRLNKYDFKELLLEYAEEYKEQEVLEWLKYGKGRERYK